MHATAEQPTHGAPTVLGAPDTVSQAPRRLGDDRVQVASFLMGKGVPAMAYHSGKAASHRQAVSAAMGNGRVRVVCCTVALSMGLDEAAIDGIVHYMLPSSMEEYVQQVWDPRDDSSHDYQWTVLRSS